MDYLTQNIAVNLNRIRISRGMSLDLVAEQTGVSKSMLHQIEKGDANPSISVLGKIASGMRVELGELLSKPPMKSNLIKVSSLPTIKEIAGQYEIRTCLPYEDNRSLELYRIDIYPGKEYISGGHGENTSEYLIVLDGELLVETDGISRCIKPDEIFMFKTDHTHKYINNGDKTLHCFCIFLPGSEV